MFFRVDGGRSRISSSGTAQGPRHRRFLALMVGALGSPAPAPPKGPAIDIFTALMVDALEPPTPTLSPRGAAVDIF
jgi:hypothetical protein